MEEKKMHVGGGGLRISKLIKMGFFAIFIYIGGGGGE